MSRPAISEFVINHQVNYTDSHSTPAVEELLPEDMLAIGLQQSMGQVSLKINKHHELVLTGCCLSFQFENFSFVCFHTRAQTVNC